VYLPLSQKELINLDVQITGLYSSAPVDFNVTLYFPNDTAVGAPQKNSLTANKFGAAYGSHGTGGRQAQGLTLDQDATTTLSDSEYSEAADATVEADCELPVEGGYYSKPICSLLLDMSVRSVPTPRSAIAACL
jgi:hypothetical protein